MSRHTIQPGKKPSYRVYVGWDRMLETFYGQVYDLESEAECGSPIFWIGAGREETPTTAELRERLREYADIPDELVAELEGDRAGEPYSPLSDLRRKLGDEVLFYCASRAEREPLFKPGKLSYTAEAAEELVKAKTSPDELLARHLIGDWGELCKNEAARKEYELAAKAGEQMMSAHKLTTGAVLFVITASDRSETTIMKWSDN